MCFIILLVTKRFQLILYQITLIYHCSISWRSVLAVTKGNEFFLFDVYICFFQIFEQVYMYVVFSQGDREFEREVARFNQ